MDGQEDFKTYPKMETFYHGKTVALTGGTGFLGQGIIEKLLRCCPGVKKIIIFIREKRNKTPAERLQDLASQQVFDVIRKTNPNFAEKLQCVTCKLDKENLGLSSEDRKLLRNEVNIMIHCAATLKFNEHLRESFDINVQCPRRIMKLCKSMRKMEAFVHISTAYTNCDHTVLEERIFTQRIHYKDLEASFRWMTDDDITKMTTEMLGKKPNSYALTKAMAEDAVVEERGSLPACILRPSMIVGALQEPMPGWCTNVYGPTAFMCSFCKGVNHCVVGDPYTLGNIVPVDFVVNGTLLSAMKTAVDFARRRDSSMLYDSDSGNSTDIETDEDVKPKQVECDVVPDENDTVPVYVINSCTTNPCYIGLFELLTTGWNHEIPTMPVLPPFHTFTTRNKNLYQFLAFVTQSIPARIFDVFLMMSKSRLRLSRLNEKIMAGQEVMAFFFLNSLVIESHKTQAQLKDGLSNEDLKTFSIDTRRIDWVAFFKVYMQGAQKFILKENTDDYSKAKKVYNRMLAVQTTLMTSCKFGMDFLLANFGVQTPMWHSNSYNFERYHYQPSQIKSNQLIRRYMKATMQTI